MTHSNVFSSPAIFFQLEASFSMIPILYVLEMGRQFWRTLDLHMPSCVVHIWLPVSLCPFLYSTSKGCYVRMLVGKPPMFNSWTLIWKTFWPQSFAFLFVLKVVKETDSAKAKHLWIKYVWMLGWSTLYTFIFGTWKHSNFRLGCKDVMYSMQSQLVFLALANGSTL